MQEEILYMYVPLERLSSFLAERRMGRTRLPAILYYYSYSVPLHSQLHSVAMKYS
jgi:hypothetical protein